MTGYRLLQSGKKGMAFLLSAVLLSMAVFYMARLAPGDPLRAWYGDRVEKMSEEEKEAARDRMGLNDSIWVQYMRWLEGVLRGDFGISYQYKQDVMEVIGQRIPNSLILGGSGFLLTFLGALGLGIFCAWHEGRWQDRLLCRGGTMMSCIPEFWLALVLVLLFSVTLHWFPSSGAYDVGQRNNVLNRLQHLILPLAVVVLQHLWYYAYLVRNKLLEETRSDYVLLGKSKGLSKGRILFGHCLRNILPAYISMMAVSVPHILGGTYVVEAVFSYPGIGTLAYESARYHDYNLLMVLCMMTGILVLFCNLLGQLINESMDPRLRATGEMEEGERGAG